MGMHADAELWFGYSWDHEEYTPEDLIGGPGDDDDEWEEMVYKREGHPDPWEGYPEREANESYENHRARADLWLAANRVPIDRKYEVLKEIKARYPGAMALQTVGNHDYPSLTVAGIRVVWAYGYERRDVDLEDLLRQQPQLTADVKRFVHDLGIDLSNATEAEPSFFLVASYG